MQTVTTGMAATTREEIIRLCRQYMANPNAIIMCIQGKLLLLFSVQCMCTAWCISFILDDALMCVSNFSALVKHSHTRQRKLPLVKHIIYLTYHNIVVCPIVVFVFHISVVFRVFFVYI